MNDHIKNTCEKLLTSVKLHPYTWGIASAFIILVAIPLTIFFAYYIGDCGYILIYTNLSVGDALGFYGTILSFVGTTFLGVVAFKQNADHNRTETDLETANILTPFLIISNVTASPKSNSPQKVKPIKVSKSRNTESLSQSAPFQKNHYAIKGMSANIQIENIGQGLATHVFYKDWFGEIQNPEDYQMDLNLPVHDSFKVYIRVHPKDVDITKEVIIHYQNIIGFKYQQTLKYKLVCRPKQVDDDDWDKEYFIHVYLMGKQERVGMY